MTAAVGFLGGSDGGEVGSIMAVWDPSRYSVTEGCVRVLGGRHYGATGRSKSV